MALLAGCQGLGVQDPQGRADQGGFGSIGNDFPVNKAFLWNKQPFCTAYWGGRAVQDQIYSTAYISKADWNDSRFFNPKFDQMAVAARGELNLAQRKQMYRDIALIAHEEAGAIILMFNDTIDGIGPKVGGWVDSPVAELMGGMASSECWVTA